MRRVAPVAIVMSSLVVLSACRGSGTSRDAATTSAATTAVTTTTTTRVRPVASAGCRARTVPRAGITDGTLRVGGVTRVYQVDVPEGYDGRTPYAVLLGLHALSVSYKFIPSMTGFDKGARYRFIGVNPSGKLAGTVPFWNAAPTKANDDVAFITALLDRLGATLCIDPTKVFSTGMSNGAQMSSLLACRLPDRIAAIAPVAGEEWLPPCAGRPVPIIAFHGTADPILPYTGGGLNATRIAQLYQYGGKLPRGLPAPLGIDASMRRWAANNRCDPTPTEQRLGAQVRRRVWSGCAAATELYIVEGAATRIRGRCSRSSSKPRSGRRPPRSTPTSSSTPSSSTDADGARVHTALPYISRSGSRSSSRRSPSGPRK